MPVILDADLFQRVLSIIIIDLVLSGDNAVVIALASRHLPPRQRRLAIILGGGAAVGLRVLFTALAAILLGVPLLQAIGGVILIWIAYKLLAPEPEAAHEVREASRLWEAIRTITLADVVMSLDNVLAVGGAAHGDVTLLMFGLALSIPIVLFGSGFVANLMGRLPWLAHVGSLVLVRAATDMILHDARVSPYLPHDPVLPYVLPLAIFAAILLIIWLKYRTLGLTYSARAHAPTELERADAEP